MGVVIEQQLEYQNQSMRDKASEVDIFLLKYYFGGLVALVTLLNINPCKIDRPCPKIS